MVDFRDLKQALFDSADARVEKVEVNQRHLIDKILARYSAEFTVYRELIQNANDAGAAEIRVDFYTSENALLMLDKPSNSMEWAKAIQVHSICIQNDGRPFSDADWLRLRRIAEGNPDEQKIGFFGVGFYSLFSICEEPFVISGDRCMGFYWSGDQLYTKSKSVADASPVPPTSWTKICLNLRQPLELPDFDAFAQFLAKSLLFTESLRKASWVINDKHLIVSVDKVLSPALAIKKTAVSNFKTRPTALFELQKIETRSLQVTVDKRYHSPASSNALDTSAPLSVLSGLWKLAKSTLTEQGREEAELEASLRRPGVFHSFLQLYRASASVKASSRFADAMERTTKKRPFKTVHVDAVYASWGQLNASTDSSSKHPILGHLLPTVNGRIFIGFETHQTTGLNLHLAAPFVPTVERESIDLVDEALKTWNGELFQLAGKLCRHIYEEEAARIVADDADYLAQAKHLLKSFNFRESTPIPVISWAIFEDFWCCSKNVLPLPATSRGFVPATSLRLVDAEMRPFVKNCPRIPDEIADVCRDFLKRLSLVKSTTDYQMHSLGIDEFIETELKTRKLTQDELLPCLKWFISKVEDRTITRLTFTKFVNYLHVPSASVDCNGQEEAVLLGQIKFVIGTELLDLYSRESWRKLNLFPIDCLSPLLVGRFASNVDLIRYLGLSVLNIADWLEFVVKSSDAKSAIESNVCIAEELLVFISKYYGSAPASLDLQLFQARICSALALMKCVPVKSANGTKLAKPVDCYFEDIPQRQLLDSALKIVHVTTEAIRKKISDEMLKAAGVRAHLPLDQIFNNIDDMQWDHCQLLRYLAKFKNELARSDLEKLRQSSIFPPEAGGKRCRLSELFAPNALVEILGLKVLKWPAEIPAKDSDLGQFLHSLGFNYIVPWRLVLQGVRSANSAARSILFKYFFDNYSFYSDFNSVSIDFPCIPVADDPQMVLLPSQVFLDEALTILGFYLISSELRRFAQILGIQNHPSGTLIIDQLVKKKLPLREGTRLFEYLAKVSSIFEPADLAKLRKTSFIPVVLEDSTVEYRSPDQVFLKRSGAETFDSAIAALANLFERIDFGTQANAFLRLVGVQEDLQLEHVVQVILNEPVKVLNFLQAPKYIELLEHLAHNWKIFSRNHSALAQSFAHGGVFLGATKSVSVDSNVDDDSSPILKFSLYELKEIFVVDDTISHQLFNLPSPPPRPTTVLPTWYQQLGCRLLSAVIRNDRKCIGYETSDGPLVCMVRKLLKERLSLIGDSLEVPRAKRRLLSNAKLTQVDGIKTVRFCTINNQENVQWTCAVAADHNSSTLKIILANNKQTGQFDYFDLATVFVSVLWEGRGKVQDSLLVASLLNTPIASLRAKGFAVDEMDNIDASIVEAPAASKHATPPMEADPTQTPSSPSESPLTRPGKQAQHDSELSETKPSIQSSKGEGSSSSSSLHKLGKGLAGFIKSVTDTITQPGKTATAGTQRNEAALNRALSQGIRSLRSHADKEFTGKIPGPSPIATAPAIGSYCHVPELQSLRLYMELPNCIKFYTSTSLSEKYLQLLNRESTSAALLAFHQLIVLELGRNVFKVAEVSALHLFYDPESTAIAFNSNRALFFNFATFLSNKHHQSLAGDYSDEARRCYMFWFMTFCHELAHNFVAPHDEQHEFYMSSFAETYLEGLLQIIP